MREEAASSGGTVDPVPMARSASPVPTTAASSAGASSPAVPANVGSVDYLGSTHGSKTCSLSYLGSQFLRTSTSTNALCSSQPSCRPWEREDLLRRLATFRPSTWSGKPKGAGSLACGRRGWINVDTDKIECETCGMQLSFSASPSWTPVEAEKAREVFVGQLDFGHVVSCPWRGNCCADSLVQFPPTTPAALIGGYKDRYDGLLQFNSLPVISPSAIEKMNQSRGMQLDRLLSQSYAFLVGELSLRMENMEGAEVPFDGSSAYNQAQKLISLCGWEPRWLPTVQDFEEHSAQSARYGCSFDPTSDSKHGPSQDYGYSKNIKDTGKKVISASQSRQNSRSPLLDCSLCGATIRIWDFSTVPRPSRFGSNHTDTPETSKKLGLTRGISAASGISGWIPTDGAGKEQVEDRDEAATSNAGVDLNLTMAGSLPSIQFNEVVFSKRSDATMGRDLGLGQPSGSEVGEQAASFESRGPSVSTRKRSVEEGGSTCNEATVIDRDGDEVGDSRNSSEGPFKRARGLDIFSNYPVAHRTGSALAGPSHGISFEDAGPAFTRDSARASSVVAMDTVCRGEEDSMESVENFPADAADDAHSSPPKNLDGLGVFMYGSSTNAEEEVLNVAAETGSIHWSIGADPTADVSEHHGQTGEFNPGPGLTGEFVPYEDMDQDAVSRSAVRAESSSKVYGFAKAESVEISQGSARGTRHPSLSCNAVIYSGYEVSKEEVSQAAMVETAEYMPNGSVAVNLEDDLDGAAAEFDPIHHHHHYCPWVNGNVAAAGCSNAGGSASGSDTALSGWELTLDALDAYHTLGHIPNQTLESESAASLYKDEHLASGVKMLRRGSKSHGRS